MIDQWLKRSYFNIFNGKFDPIKLGKIEAKVGVIKNCSFEGLAYDFGR
jgi:hypothetical protein